MKAINAYLPLTDTNCPKFTEWELMQYCIAPNIPDQWRLAFWLSRGHLAATVQDASIVLEELERDKLKKKKRENNNQSGDKGDAAIRSHQGLPGGSRCQPLKRCFGLFRAVWSLQTLSARFLCHVRCVFEVCGVASVNSEFALGRGEQLRQA